jgi:hypothetical protein
MDANNFISTWAQAAKILSKRNISQEYIEFNTRKLRVDDWDEKIVKEVFDELCSGDPNECKLDADSIKARYWNKYRATKGVITDNEPKPCKQNLCNGKGLIKTEKKVAGYNWPLDYIWRCPCVLGVNVHVGVPLYEHQKAKALGHKYVVDEWFQPYTMEVHAKNMREDELRDKERAGGQQELPGMVFDDEINRLVRAKSIA